MKFEEVDWEDLAHAYGSAEDVPDLLDDLRSKDSDVFDEAMYELLGNIWHQGTVYSATAKAFPLLMQMYIEGDVKRPEAVAALILAIASGSGYYQVHRSNSNEPPSNLESLLVVENAVVKSIRNIFEKHLDIFIPYLEHKEPDLRLFAVQAFGCYSKKKEKLLPLLEKTLKNEGNNDLVPYVEESILKLKKHI